MSYSPAVQAQIDARAAQQRKAGPSFPMPRLNHNGETGEWLIREISGDKNAEEMTVFEREGMVKSNIINKEGKTYEGFTGGKWQGIILRVAWMSQTKWKPNAIKKRLTREFTDFKNEPIELLESVFGPAGRTTSLKVYPNYQAFKDAGMLKDEDGNPAGTAYDLKVVLYVYHVARKQVIKLVLGGTARSEWFEYARNKPSGDEGIVSRPWVLTQPTASLLESVITQFEDAPSKTAKGGDYFRLSFTAIGLADEAQLVEAFAQQDRINEWVKGWEAVNARMLADKAIAAGNAAPSAPAPVAPAVIPGVPGTAAHAIATAAARAPEEEINLDDIPF